MLFPEKQQHTNHWEDRSSRRRKFISRSRIRQVLAAQTEPEGDYREREGKETKTQTRTTRIIKSFTRGGTRSKPGGGGSVSGYVGSDRNHCEVLKLSGVKQEGAGPEGNSETFL